MKRIIVYRSFFGTTIRYAESLHKEIESDIEKYNKVDEPTLRKYDMVILCTGTYAGWISLSGYLKKHWHVLKEVEVVLIVVGVAPVDVPWSIRSYNKIPKQIREGIKYFKLPAKVDSKAINKATKEYLAPVIEYIKSKDK